LFYPTDHKAEDSDGTIFFSESPSKSQKDGFLEGDFVAVYPPEGETSKTDKVDKDFKTTVNQTDISGQFHR